MKNKTYILIFLLFSITSVALPAKAQTTNYKSYAVFVHSIAKYSRWPDVKDEFKIVVLGNSKVYDELRSSITGKTISSAMIKVERADILSDINGAHLIYISNSKSNELDDLSTITNGKPIMIIAEREGLHKKGASVSFVIIDNKLRFDINQTELLKRNVKISSQVTALAHEVL